MKPIIFATTLAVLIATQTLYAQAQYGNTKFQVEYSLNRNSAVNMYAIHILYTDHEIQASQTERSAFYLAATQIRDLNRWLGVRYGLSLSDRGYLEDLTVIDFVDGSFEESSKNIRMYYLGAPLSLAFNLKNNKRLISGFAEAGLSPELLLNYTRSNYMNYDLNRFALIGLVNAGLKVNFRNNYSLVISPGVRYALVRYDTEPDQPFQIREFRPISTNITLGFQF